MFGGLGPRFGHLTRELLREKGLVLWAAESSTAEPTRFAAVFNTYTDHLTVRIQLAELGCELTGRSTGWICEEGWSRTTTTVIGSDTLDVGVPAHGAALLRCAPVDR